jgi:uncharacterized protein with PIN domain
VVVLDTYALVALVAGEPAADEVESLLAADRAAMSVVNFAEAVDVLQRVYDASPAELEQLADQLFSESVELLDVGYVEAFRAGLLRGRHYDRSVRPLSLADCFLLASASPEDAVATSDPPVVEVARLEGVGVVALPDSERRRP